ncbi:nitrogenase component 1 [uncultured Phascolarctobacterium sp.]|uniref:nitrogenase component 1 n=1 Tax=uncultured Phascolarctobacterium sp. TaxID=512296 RepID=UPI0025E82036|nr:nitrogenase component 1 [uncultured Phascolarctobacterium sp.]
MNNLNKFRPCTGYCQMIGAAAAILSVKNTSVILNSPRWCAVIGERELTNAVKNYETRLFCSEARQKDILYGVEESLSASLAEVLNVNNPSLLAVLTSCSMSLIGDDIEGICKKNNVTCPILAIETGGFTGAFANGYQKALLELLKKSTFKVSTSRQKNKVNLLGICTCFPHWQGDLAEIKRLLSAAGYEIGIVLGEDQLELAELEKLSEAALNIVLTPEMGSLIAESIYEQTGQRYIIAPWPYGFTNTVAWLQAVGEALQQPPKLKAVNSEIEIAAKDIFDECCLVKHNYLEYRLQRIITTAPCSIADSILRGIQNSECELLLAEEFYLKRSIQENDSCSNKYRYWDESMVLEQLKPDNYQLFLGSERERMAIGDFDKTLYLNFSMPSCKIKSKNIFFAGIRGWQNFMQLLIDQINTLEYINNNKK